MTDHVKNQLCARIEELEAEKMELNEQLDIAQQERDALAAHVELFKAKAAELKERYPLSPWIKQHYDYFVKTAPETSLARLKAQWQAEALETVASVSADEGKPWDATRLRRLAAVIRRQAEGGEA